MHREIQRKHLLARNKLVVLALPSQSLDLNCIENLWNDGNVAVQQQNPIHFSQLLQKGMGGVVLIPVFYPCGELCKKTGSCKCY